MELKDKKILIISPEKWGVNFLSKHHYALALARLGNDVYFINPPCKEYQTIEIEDGLHVINYRPIIRGINVLPGILRSTFTLINIRRVLHLMGDLEIDIVWSFDPYRFQNLQLFKAKYSIYHSVDVHRTKLENQIADSADFVFAVSDVILKRISTTKPKFKINHGLADHFVNYEFSYNVPDDRIKVGYVGNLQSYLLDREILKKIINDNESIDFYFIGPHSSSNLSRYTVNDDFVKFIKCKNNCFLEGSIPSELLPEKLNSLHIFLMCYSGIHNKNDLSNSHKILEYLSTGRVVVSNYFDEYNERRDILEMVDANIDLPSRFEEVVLNLESYNSSMKRTLRRAYAIENSYKKRIREISGIISSIL